MEIQVLAWDKNTSGGNKPVCVISIPFPLDKWISNDHADINKHYTS